METKKRALYQIWLPLIISIIFIGYLFFILMRSTNGNATALSQWSDISLVYMLLPIIGISLLTLVLSILMIYFIGQLIPKTRLGLSSLNRATGQVKQKTQQTCLKTIRLFYGPSAWLKQYRGVHKDER